MDMRTLFDETDDGPVLRVHVQPGAGGTKVTGTFGSALKVRVAAPPVDGRANEATRALLADALGLASGDVELTGGDSSRAKRFRLRGVDAEDAERRLRVALGTPGPPKGRPVAER